MSKFKPGDLVIIVEADLIPGVTIELKPGFVGQEGTIMDGPYDYLFCPPLGPWYAVEVQGVPRANNPSGHWRMLERNMIKKNPPPDWESILRTADLPVKEPA